MVGGASAILRYSERRAELQALLTEMLEDWDAAYSSGAEREVARLTSQSSVWERLLSGVDAQFTKQLVDLIRGGNANAARTSGDP